MALKGRLASENTREVSKTCDSFGMTSYNTTVSYDIYVESVSSESFLQVFNILFTAAEAQPA